MLTQLKDVNWNNLNWTARINAYSALTIPLLAFVTPRVIHLDDQRTEVRIRLDRRSRNHLGVMYFGALAMGAELSIALKALETIAESGKKIDFIFKDFNAQFLKRADGHVHFHCEDAGGVRQMIEDAANGSERLSRTFRGFANVPSRASDPVMTYELTLSVRRRG